MYKKIMAILAIWIFIAQNMAVAQDNFTIRGLVQDSSGKPVDLATVILFKSGDSTLVKTNFTTANGAFLFDQLSEGQYFVRLSAMGFSSFQSAVQLLKVTQKQADLGVIGLRATTELLKEVSIAGKKAFIEQKLDRVVVNVDALIANAGTTAMDVLTKSPGVSVGQDGSISLKGKNGVTIFVDDKPLYLSGTELESYLNSLPSSGIDKLEIMTNPPANYDAAGNGGVINIKTKKGAMKGFNGGLNLSLTQGKKTRSVNSANFNMRQGKINSFANLSYNQLNNFMDLDINRVYLNADASPKSYFNQNTYADRSRKLFNLKAGADYAASDQTTWGIVLTAVSQRGEDRNKGASNLLNATRELDSLIALESQSGTKLTNGAINLNYRHQFNKNGHGITADADYILYRTSIDQVFNNFSYFPDATLKSKDMLTGALPSDINIYSLKTDYTLPLKKDWKFAAGLKTSYTKTDNIADYMTTVDGVTEMDYNKSNHFLYKENISAAYVNLNKEMKRLSVQAGLRLENTVSDGHQMGNLMKADSSFRRNYAGLFPTLYLLYKLDTSATHQIGLNYGRRLDRPYYQDLNPFLSPLDKFTYYEGNPFLKPSYTQSIELSHTYKSKYTTTLSYANTKDDVNETIQILDGIYYSRPGNLGRKVVKSISFNGTFDPAAWLNINLYSELTNITTKTDFYTGRLNTSGTYWFANATTGLKLGAGWDGELSGNYRTRLHDAQFVLGKIWQANAAVQKKLSAKTTLKLSVNDIFYSRINRGTINNLAQTTANWVNRGDSRTAVLSFSYRFGKAFTAPAKHEESGAESEKNRVKN